MMSFHSIPKSLVDPILWVLLLPIASHAQSKVGRPKVSVKTHEAIADWLLADEDQEGKALAKVLQLCHKRLDVTAEALRTLLPLTFGKPGTQHGLEFLSGGKTWEYSIRLPKGYDNRKRYPVLVLPDHASVGPEPGIAYWEQSNLVEEFILFRPVILKHRGDKKRFSRRQFFDLDIDIARVMRDALRSLKLHYAVDHDRFFMTGLSQAGYYTYYYAVSFPDIFAGIVPESAGGMALRASVVRLASNLKNVQIRILHAKGDKIVPYSDAELMRKSLDKAGGKVELIAFTAKDYRQRNPKQHPTPHRLRIGNILPWCLAQPTRQFATSIDRVLRYPQQGHEARFRISPPTDWKKPVRVRCSARDGKLEANITGVLYQVSPEDVLSKKRFSLGKKKLRPKANLELLLRSYKAMPDPRRLVAAEISID